MTRFYLLRHGETEWNHQGNKYCGITDIRLNDTGRAQAMKAAAALHNASIEAIYCSPLNRSMETASVLAEPLGLSPIVDARIREIDFGEWEGKKRSEIEADFPEEWKKWTDDPGAARAGIRGETGLEVWSRMQSFFNEMRDLHRNRSIAVVGHNTSNRLFIAGSLEVPFHKYRSLVQNNAAISVLESGPDELRWLHLNQISHLTPIHS